MRENAFVEAWKTQHRRVSMILGLTLLCAPSALSVYAENGVNDITVQAVMQTKTVKGTVLDENGEPLIGVSIVVKGTSTGTITDFDGKFSINLPGGSKELVVSYIGYKDICLECPKAGDVGTIRLEPDAIALGEAVVTGKLPTYQLKGSSLVTNIRETLLSTVGTANDVLSHIPGLEIYRVRQGRAFDLH